MRELTDGRGVDVAVDHVGGAAFAGALASLSNRGRLVLCGASSGDARRDRPRRRVRPPGRDHRLERRLAARASRGVPAARRGQARPAADRGGAPASSARRTPRRCSTSRDHFGRVLLDPRLCRVTERGRACSVTVSKRAWPRFRGPTARAAARRASRNGGVKWLRPGKTCSRASGHTSARRRETAAQRGCCWPPRITSTGARIAARSALTKPVSPRSVPSSRSSRNAPHERLARRRRLKAGPHQQLPKRGDPLVRRERGDVALARPPLGLDGVPVVVADEGRLEDGHAADGVAERERRGECHRAPCREPEQVHGFAGCRGCYGVHLRRHPVGLARRRAPHPQTQQLHAHAIAERLHEALGRRSAELGARRIDPEHARRGQYAIQPPSTSRFVPLTYEHSSEAR